MSTMYMYLLYSIEQVLLFSMNSKIENTRKNDSMWSEFNFYSMVQYMWYDNRVVYTPTLIPN